MIDGVLLIAFGGPEDRSDIRPFLENVAQGRAIPPERLATVTHHYLEMPGGRSPLNALTRAQARALEATLAEGGHALPVFVGMRNWHPFLHETLAAMRDKGVRRALGLIMSAFRTEASWERYMKDVAGARQQTPGAPEIIFGPPWFDHPGFIQAVADRTQAALAEVPSDARVDVPVVFTAHSVPMAMAGASPYVADFTSAARSVAALLGRPRFTLAYQSRSGSPRDPWLEPDVGNVLTRLAAEGQRHAVVVPIGFVCDHVEVLYDLDVEAFASAAAAGLTLHRAEAVNDHPAFVAMLADLVHLHAGATP